MIGIQEHFARRLATIKEAYIDAENRAKQAIQEKQLQKQIDKLKNVPDSTKRK